MDAVQKICWWLVKGYSLDEVLAELPGHFPDANPESTYLLALEKMAAVDEIQVRAERNKGIARLNSLYRRSEEVHDFGQCLAVQKEINSRLSLRREPPSVSLPDLTNGYNP